MLQIEVIVEIVNRFGPRPLIEAIWNRRQWAMQNLRADKLADELNRLDGLSSLLR